MHFAWLKKLKSVNIWHSYEQKGALCNALSSTCSSMVYHYLFLQATPYLDATEDNCTAWSYGLSLHLTIYENERSLQQLSFLYNSQ